MIPPGNEKVASLEPRWTPFSGFSLLFDNPGASLTAAGAVAYLETPVDQNPELRLYRALDEALAQLGRPQLLGTYGLCTLPAASYHVTVWDGVNRGNVASVAADRRAQCQRLLERLPQSLDELESFFELSASPLLVHTNWNLQLCFAGLEKWSNVSLVARLAPANDASQRTLEQIVQARGTLSAAFRQRWGVAPCESYVPHVTLGYFAHPGGAEETTPHLGSWNAVFRERTAGLTLAFRRIGLYGFSDMATFFRIRPQ